jgi:hypothetical protein
VTIRVSIGPGVTYDVTLDLHIRSDVRGYRLRPDQPVAEQLPSPVITHMHRTTAQWTASGSLTQTSGDTTTRVEMSGSSLVKADGPGGLIALMGTFTLRQRRLEVRMHLHVDDVRRRRVVTTRGTVTHDETGAVPVDLNLPAGDSQVVFEFDDRWNLQAGTAKDSYRTELLGTREATVTVSWPAVSARCPPERDQGGV